MMPMGFGEDYEYTNGDPKTHLTEEERGQQLLAMLDMAVERIKRDVAKGQRIEIDARAGQVETEPQNGYVTRKATGEYLLQVFVGPARWSKV